MRISRQRADFHALLPAGSQRLWQCRTQQQRSPVKGARTGLYHQRTQRRIAAPGPDDAIDTTRGGGADDHTQVLWIADAVQGQQALGRQVAQGIQVIIQGVEPGADDIHRDALVLLAIL